MARTDGRLETWEAYAEFSGGRVLTILKGTTREQAEEYAKRRIDYDANEMGSTVEEFERDENKTVWLTDGTICGAYREWAHNKEDETDTIHMSGGRSNFVGHQTEE